MDDNQKTTEPNLPARDFGQPQPQPFQPLPSQPVIMPAEQQQPQNIQAVQQPQHAVDPNQPSGQQAQVGLVNQTGNDAVTPRTVFEIIALVVGIIAVIGLLTGNAFIGYAAVVVFFVIGLMVLAASLFKLSSPKNNTDATKKERSVWAVIGISFVIVLAGAGILMAALFAVLFVGLIYALSTGPST